MKKLILAGLAACLIQTSMYASSIGYVDYDKIVESYPLAQRYKTELDKKFETIDSYVQTKEKEIQKAAVIDQPLLKQEAFTQIEKMQKDYLSTKEARERDIIGKIQSAAEKVRVEKNLDFIIKSDTMISGGTDISADIIQKLK